VKVKITPGYTSGYTRAEIGGIHQGIHDREPAVQAPDTPRDTAGYTSRGCLGYRIPP